MERGHVTKYRSFPLHRSSPPSYLPIATRRYEIIDNGSNSGHRSHEYEGSEFMFWKKSKVVGIKDMVHDLISASGQLSTRNPQPSTLNRFCENRSAQATSPCNPTAILYRVTSHIRNCLPPRTIICPYGVYATVGSWWGAISHEQSTPVGNVPLQSHYNPVCAESTKWLQHQTYVKDMMNGEEYRGNSLIKNSPLLEPLSRTMPRAIWWP